MPRIETIIMKFPDGSDLSELMDAHLNQEPILGGLIIGIGEGDYFKKLDEAEDKIYELKAFIEDEEGLSW